MIEWDNKGSLICVCGHTLKTHDLTEFEKRITARQQRLEPVRKHYDIRTGECSVEPFPGQCLSSARYRKCGCRFFIPALIASDGRKFNFTNVGKGIGLGHALKRGIAKAIEVGVVLVYLEVECASCKKFFSSDQLIPINGIGKTEMLCLDCFKKSTE